MNLGSIKDIIQNPKIKITLTIIILTIIISFTAKFVFSQLIKPTKQLIGIGQLVSVSPDKQIKSPITGKILSISANNQKVKAGQVLLVIETRTTIKGITPVSNYAIPEGAALKVLPPLPAALPTLPDITEAIPVNINNVSNTNFKAQYKEALKTEKHKESIFKLKDADHSNYEELYKQGIISKKEMQNLEVDYIKAKQEYETAKQEVIAIKTTLSKPKNPETTTVKYKAQVLSDSNIKARTISKKYLIKAPSDGIVRLKPFKKGDIVQSGKIILSISPLNTSFTANITVKGNDISSIHLLQKVHLKIEKLPVEFKGVVQAINPSKYDAKSKLQSYIIQIKPEKNMTKDSNNKTYTLKDQMKLSVEF